MHFLVTAGPTREPLDDIRFLSNRSTGKMGFEVARAAHRAGHRVTLITGPVDLPPPDDVQVVEVETALQMHAAVMEHLKDADVLVMAAAVADFRPRERRQGKRKKEGSEDWLLSLTRTPDILKEAGAVKGARIHVGFAAESEDLLVRAKGKLEAKNLDLIVGNSVSAFGADRATAHFLFRDGPPETFRDVPKGEIAHKIVTLCQALRA
ncbi:MAG: phosphopantothenoylcysteine decarboxylase domain-containing protein [Planctomycetota bacterium]|jgi:phosphopantothenoylcysteine decarboxylase/phosphopantothenate--cysteine ligase